MYRGLIVRRRRLGRTSVREICRYSRTGLVAWRNDTPMPAGEFDVIIRWGCTSSVPGGFVLNSCNAIRQVGDKAGFRLLVQATRPDLVPRTWTSLAQVDGYRQMLAPDGEFLYTRAGRYVVRPGTHAQGRNLYVCSDIRNLTNAVKRCGPSYYISELFPKTHEYRVFIVQGRVGWVTSKTPGNPHDVAWNVARGGRFDNVRWRDWNLSVVRAAVDAFNLTDLDFGGVDVMWNENTGEAKVLEINSAPSQTSPYRQQCTAKCFDWIMREESKNRIPIKSNGSKWQHFAHPAIREEAPANG